MKKKNAADEHENTNHAERNSGVHQWQASTLLGRPSLVTGARTDKFGLSFWGPNSCMSAYHSVQGERSGGERESTQSKRTEGQKGESWGESGGRIFPIRWSNGEKQGKEWIFKKRKRKACVPFGLAVRRFSQFLPTQEDIQNLLEKWLIAVIL